MFKGRHFDQSVILLCVRWYPAYNLSLRDLEEMMAERGLNVDHSTVHRWVVHFSPKLLERFNRRKRSVTGKWHVDETYIKVRGQWMYLYRAIDSVGDTVEFYFGENRDLSAARRFLRKALELHGRPDRIVIDGSQTNREAILSCDAENRLRDRSRRSLKPIRVRQSQYLNNRIEQDHRRIKRRVRSMLGFKSFTCATATLAGIEMIHMMRNRQARYAYNPDPAIAEQFAILTAENQTRLAVLRLASNFATEPRAHLRHRAASPSASAHCLPKRRTANVLWDCVSMVSDEAVAEITLRGGPAGHRHLAQPLLFADGRLERSLRRRADLPPRGRPPVDHAAASLDRQLGRAKRSPSTSR